MGVVGMGMLIVSVPPRLAGQRCPAFAGCRRCCPAERLHGDGVCIAAGKRSSSRS